MPGVLPGRHSDGQIAQHAGVCGRSLETRPSSRRRDSPNGTFKLGLSVPGQSAQAAPPGQSVRFFPGYLRHSLRFFQRFEGSKNAYNPYLTTTGLSDCQTIGVMPYCAPSVGAGQSVIQYQNPTSFQIISAGRDVTWGSPIAAPSGTHRAAQYPALPASALLAPGPKPWYGPSSPTNGTIWSPATSPPLPVGVSGDDRTNFCPNILQAGDAP